MPIDFDSQAMTVQMIWESANLRSGGGSTSLAFNTDLNGAFAINEFMETIRDAWVAQLQDATDVDYTLASLQWETETLSGELGVGLAGDGSITGLPSNCALILSYKAAEKGPATAVRATGRGCSPRAPWTRAGRSPRA